LCSHGDVTDVVKVFSPILKEGQTEREIFAQIGSKIVRLGVESAFEYAGEKAGITVGTGLHTAVYLAVHQHQIRTRERQFIQLSS
jgi:hypothetical protein